MYKYDVVIVGSGIGGLCCGSILALSVDLTTIETPNFPARKKG